LRTRATSRADCLAYRFLVDEERAVTLSYTDLDRRARSIAVALRRAGLAGERALLVFEPGLAFVEAFFGCVMAGVVAVPVNPPRRKSDRVDAILADAGSRAIVGSARGASALKGVASLAGEEELRWIFTNEVADALADEWVDPEVAPSALALLQYTSGSTAAPRGVKLTHANLLHNLAAIDRWTSAPGEETHGVFWLPHFHDMGLMGGILQHVFWGGSATLMAPD
jgi:acyl-CoA synthetase (AMP-forming)/AMP-acid ligase II